MSGTLVEAGPHGKDPRNVTAVCIFHSCASTDQTNRVFFSLKCSYFYLICINVIDIHSLLNHLLSDEKKKKPVTLV